MTPHDTLFADIDTDVTHTRSDDVRATVPVVTIYRVGSDELIADHRVFFHLAPVFAT